MLYRKFIKDFISHCYSDEELKNIKLFLVDRDTLEGLQLVSNKPISVSVTEDTAIVTIHLTRDFGLRCLALRDFEYNDLGVDQDLDDMQTVILFDVDGEYMICDNLHSSDCLHSGDCFHSDNAYNIAHFEFSIYLTKR